jgi:hypothetical protein
MNPFFREQQVELAGAALQARRGEGRSGESSDKHCAVKRRTVSVIG